MEKDPEKKIENEIVPTRRCPSFRLSMALLMFLGSLTVYMNRVNMSMALVCMTEDRNTTEEYVPPEFTWNASLRGFIMSSFYIGYILTQIPTGLVIHKVNAKWVQFGGMIIVALTSFLSPVAARGGWGYLVALQIIKGLANGSYYPCNQCVISEWSPPQERALTTALSMTGSSLGNVLTFALSGYLCDHGFAGGWPSIFYSFGIAAAIWLVMYALFAYETPAKHPWISEKERDYIEFSLASQVPPKRVAVPWKSVLTSLEVWAIIIADFGYSWIWFTALTSLPTYFSDVLNFEITENGLFNSLPHILYLLVAFFSSYMVDFLSTKNVPLTKMRKVVVSLELLLSAGFILGVSFVDDTTTVVALLTFSVGFLGISRAGHFVNMVEVAPRFAGPVMSVANTVSNIAGIIAPIITAEMTPNKTQEEWVYVFILAACLNFAAFIFYAIFGSAEVQPWARVEDDEILPEKDINSQEILNMPYVNNGFTFDNLEKENIEVSQKF